jgi:hypothetical protein
MLEAAFAGVVAVDWAQTRYMQRAWSATTGPDFHENNPLLGRHPSIATINAAGIAGVVAHAVVTAALPAGKLRTTWQAVSLGVEASNDLWNVSIGCRITF